MNALGQNVVTGSQRDMAQKHFRLRSCRSQRRSFRRNSFPTSFTTPRFFCATRSPKALAACAKELVSLILFAGVLVYQDWQLSLVSVLTLPIVAWITRNLGRSVRKASTRSMVETGGLSTALAEMLDGRRIVRAYGLEAHAVARVVAAHRSARQVPDQGHPLQRHLRARRRYGRRDRPRAGVLMAGYQSISGHLEISNFGSFVTAMALAQQPVRNLSNVWTVTTSGMGAAKRVFALIDTRPGIVDAPDAKALKLSPPPFGAGIRFENVGFGYSNGQAALDGVSFSVPPGKKIALVGPSGAGKSTIFNLLLRFYEAGEGKIEIDGQDIRGVTMQSLRASIALVTQEAFLFDESIGANIGYGQEHARPEAIVAAAARPLRRMNSFPSFPPVTTPRSVKAGCVFPAARNSASPSPAPCCAMLRSCCWTKRPRRSIRKTNGWCRRR